MDPAVMLGVVGVTARPVTVPVEAETVSVVVPLTPLSVAVMVAEPAAAPVARPLELMVASEVFEELQVTCDVIFAVDPSA